jgi:hypothetical protein
MICPKCRGAKHIRNGRAWIRCECAREITNSLYIKASIRNGETSYPPELDKYPPLELRDLTISGEYHAFRKMAWRSIAYYEAIDLRYDYFDAYRLVEIFLGQDTTYGRVRDLDDYGLVVLALGVSDLPNRMLAPLVCQLLTQRKMGGLATWVYTHQVGSSLRTTYGNALADLLGPICSDVYDVREKPKVVTSGRRDTSFIGS